MDYSVFMVLVKLFLEVALVVVTGGSITYFVMKQMSGRHAARRSPRHL